MSIQVRVPQIFRRHTGGAKTVVVEGMTVRDILENLDKAHPGLRDQLLDGKELHRFVNIYRNDEDIRFLKFLDTEVQEGDVISILPAVAGGARVPTRRKGVGGRKTAGGPRPAADAVDAIGNTPLVEVQRISPKPSVRIFCKLEFYNPTGSLKDRIAKYMVEEAERRRLLTPGQTIIEPTSGNTGISLAMIGRRKGYKVKVVVPENITVERRQLLELYGAEIIYSDARRGTNGAIEVAKKMATLNRDWYMPYQYGNAENVRAHYETTGAEILAALPHVDAFVAGLGTGGTLMGVGRRLKEVNPKTQVIAVEPHPGDLVQGLRSLEEGFIPPILDLSLLDGKFLVDSRCAFALTRDLTRKEGIFAGVSSGAVLHAAIRMAHKMNKGNIVCLLADGGWKYVSLGVWAKELPDLGEDVYSHIWW
jgi:cysteine synthase B